MHYPVNKRDWEAGREQLWKNWCALYDRRTLKEELEEAEAFYAEQVAMMKDRAPA